MFSSHNITKDLEVLRQLELSKDEYYVAFLLYQIKIGNQDAMDAYRLLLKDYIHSTEDMLSLKREIVAIPLNKVGIDRLKKSGIFTKLDEAKTKQGGNQVIYDINKQKLISIFITPNEAFEQLCNLFRGVKLTDMQNNQYLVVNILDRKKAISEYADAISYSANEHLKVLKICKDAIQNELIKTGLEKIITNRSWKEWEITNKEDIITKYNKKDILDGLE